MTTWVSKVSEGGPMQRIRPADGWVRLRAGIDLFPLPGDGVRTRLEWQIGGPVAEHMPPGFTVAWFRDLDAGGGDQTGGNEYWFPPLPVRRFGRWRHTQSHVITDLGGFSAVWLGVRVYGASGPLLVDTVIVKVDPL